MPRARSGPKRSSKRPAAAPRIAAAEAEAAIARSGPAPVYLLAGPEAVLRDRIVAALRARVVVPEFEAFNFRVLSPAGLDGPGLAGELRVLPMGGGGRLVVLGPGEKLLKDPIGALGDYAADPAPSTCLVVWAGEVKEALRKALAGAVAVDCGSPWEDRIPAHLMEEARALGVKLAPAAAAALAARCGRDLSRAVSELRKAAVGAGEGGAVTKDLVEDLSGGAAVGDVFKVASALARGDTAAAIGAARGYLETEDRGEPRVLYELGMHLRRLLAARANLSAGMPPREAAKSAGVFWKDVDAFAASLRGWSEPRIRAAYRRLLDADRRVKRGSDGLPAIEAYLWHIHAAGAGRGR